METYHGRRNRRLASVGAVIGLVTGAVVALSWWDPFRVEVDGDSMRPALEPGDRLVATRRGLARRGALVVVERADRPGTEIVKRVVGVPGGLGPDATVLEPRTFWIEGDDPVRSTDSRTFGPVRAQEVRGVVRFRYAPLARFGRIERARR